MSVLTCKLPSALDGRLADLANRRGVPKPVLVREAIEAKIAEEAAAPRRRPANLLEALGDSVGSVASGNLISPVIKSSFATSVDERRDR
jgi:predicted transcriptional regulator